jgi:hypothetical protein
MTNAEISAVLAQQDQDVEDAKRWCYAGAGSYNAQLLPLWQFCCLTHDTELMETMSRFAMIGIRHVLTALDAEGK